jgi:hypothetical protein
MEVAEAYFMIPFQPFPAKTEEKQDIFAGIVNVLAKIQTGNLQNTKQQHY